MWWLVRLVALLEQEFQPVIDKCKIQKKSVTSEAISPVADNLLPSFRVVAVNSCKDLVMRKAVGLLDRIFVGRPFAKLLIIILKTELSLAAMGLMHARSSPHLIVTNWHGVVDVIPNRLELLLQKLVLLFPQDLDLLLLFLHVLFLY